MWLTGVGGGGSRVGIFSYLPPLKPRYVLWSGVFYSPKNTVTSLRDQDFYFVLPPPPNQLGDLL